MLTVKKREFLVQYKSREKLTANQRSLRRFIYADMKQLIADLQLVRDSALNTPDMAGGAPGRRFADMWGELLKVVLQKPANWKDLEWKSKTERCGVKLLTAEEFEAYKQEHWWQFNLPNPHTKDMLDDLKRVYASDLEDDDEEESSGEPDGTSDEFREEDEE